MSGQGDGYQRGNYGRDYRGDYRSNDSYNRSRQPQHGGHSGGYGSGGQHGGGHYNQGSGHVPHQQSRDPRHSGRSGASGSAYPGPGRVGSGSGGGGRETVSSAPQSRDPRHGNRSFHSSSQHGGGSGGGVTPPPTPPPTSSSYNRDRDRDRDRPSSSSPRQAASSPQQAAAVSTPKSSTAAKDNDTDASEMTVEVGLGIIPTAHCSVLVEKDDSLHLFLGDNDGNISAIDVRGDRSSVSYFKTKAAVTDITTTSDQSHLIAAVGRSILLYSVAGLIKRLPTSSEPETNPTSKKDRLLAKRRIDATEPIKPIFEIQLSKEGSAIAVSLLCVDGKLFAGDSEGFIHTYSLTRGNKLSHKESSRYHNCNVTGISATDTQLISSSSAGTVVVSSLSDTSDRKQLIPCVMEIEKRTGATKRAASGLQKAAAYTSSVVCAVTCIDVDSDGLWLAVGGDVPYVSIISLLTGKVVRVMILPNSDWKVKSLKFVRASIIVGVDDSCVLSYSLAGELQSSRFTPCDTVHTIAASSSGSWAVSGKNTNSEVF